MISDVLAGIPVDDFETASAWYRLFAGRAPDATPRPGESVWRLADRGSICLERHVGFLALRGIAPDAIETIPGVVRRATIIDPAGNTITLAQSLRPDEI
jgi:hypothetical protein